MCARVGIRTVALALAVGVLVGGWGSAHVARAVVMGPAGAGGAGGAGGASTVGGRSGATGVEGRPATLKLELWMLQAQSLVADRKFEEIAAFAEEGLRLAMKDPEAARPEVVVRLAALRQFGRTFARLTRVEGPEKETLAWLLSRERLLTTLMLAVSAGDPPDTLLKVLSRLHADHGERAAQFADLATAFSLVFDAVGDMTGEDVATPDPQRASRLFGYFVSARARLKFDPLEMPWQLSVWMVDSPLTEAETIWALGRYGTRKNPASAFDDVRYEDYPNYTPNTYVAPVNGKMKADPPANVPMPPVVPTLEQITRFGGTVPTQVYFTVELCKALGMPAAKVQGEADPNSARVWAAVFEPDGGRGAFDLQIGRYDEYVGWPGQVMDPENHELIAEEELAMLGDVRQTPRDQRELSEAWAESADLGAAPARMMLRALELSPTNRTAWASLRKMGKESKLSSDETDKVLDLVEKRLAPKYAGFALDVLLDVVSWRGTAAQLSTVTKAATMFARRPDVLMRLAVIRGDLLADSRQERDAAQVYARVIEHAGECGPAAAMAMARLDKMMRDRGEGKELVEIYRRVWGHLPVPRPSVRVEATAYFQVGAAFAILLEESGEAAAATGVRQRLAALQQQVAVTRGK